MVSEKILSFTDLNAWKTGHELVLSVYKICDKLPAKEQFALSSQLRRAAVSITSNIAEGFSRRTSADKVHFYYIAHGSLTEVQNQLIIAKDVHYINETLFQSTYENTIVCHKLLTGLIKSITKG